MNFFCVGKRKSVQWVTHEAQCLGVFPPVCTVPVLCCLLRSVCSCIYLWRSLNHRSCHFCVGPFVKACPVLPIWLSVFAVNHRKVCACLCGQAEPDEVTDKSWPFRGPSLFPSYRLSINYFACISQTKWCISALPHPPPPGWALRLLFQNGQLIQEPLSSLVV